MGKEQSLIEQGKIFELANMERIEELRENLEGVEIEFPTIKIVHSSQRFETPTGDVVKTFKGIVLFHHNCNAWWKDSFDESGGGSAPDCSSLDGINPRMDGEAVQNDQCGICPLNAWGTETKDGKPGRGKACKNMKRLYILCEGDILPSCLVVSPGNKKIIDKFITLVTMKGLLLRDLIVEFKLKEETNQDGVKYSAPDLLHNLEKENLRLLSSEQSTAIKTMKDTYMPVMKSWEEIGGSHEGV